MGFVCACIFCRNKVKRVCLSVSVCVFFSLFFSSSKFFSSFSSKKTLCVVCVFDATREKTKNTHTHTLDDDDDDDDDDKTLDHTKNRKRALSLFA